MDSGSRKSYFFPEDALFAPVHQTRPIVQLALRYFVLAFTALLPVVNPLGSALVFLGLAGAAPPNVLRSLAREIALTTILFLFVIELVGAALLTFFGISLPVVQVAGGMVLAEMGWRLLNERTPPLPPADLTPPPETVGGLQQGVFYPFTFPVTVGPGCIVVMVTVSAHASRSRLVDNVFTHAGILVAVVVLSIMVYLSYSYAPRITQRIAPQTVHGIFRVIAFILLCIGVQIAWNGLELLIRGVAT